MKLDKIKELSQFYKARRYKNKKNSKIYTILCIACDSTNSRDGRPLAIYIDVENDPDITFARDLDEFEEKFDLFYGSVVL